VYCVELVAGARFVGIFMFVWVRIAVVFIDLFGVVEWITGEKLFVDAVPGCLMFLV
jgi:hypothetical protein